MSKLPKKKMPKSKIPAILSDTGLKMMAPVDQLIFLLKKLFCLKIVKIGVLCFTVVLAAPFVIFFTLRPTPQKQLNYGVNFSKKYAIEMGQDWKDTYIKLLDDLGAKNYRLIAYWDEIEREQGKFDFSDIKWQLDEAEKRNVNVIMTIGRKVPRYPECFEPEWWKNTPKEQDRDQALYNYIKVAANELKSYKSIKIWQVENEPFFPFGTCLPIKANVVKKEVELVRAIDPRPILIQDSGEGGFWKPSYEMGDLLAISMYRKIWYDFWGVFFGRFIYFQYPLAHWTYKIKADLVGVPYQNIYVTELQAEPWGPGSNSKLSQEDIDHTMSRQDFVDTLNYAQKAGFKHLYFWGAEWWLFEKETKGNSFYWNTAKEIFKQ